MNKVIDKYIGAYRIESELGEGGFGIVYKAYQPFLDRKVAIKTLHTDLTANPQIEQQFMHEARTIARLRHPGIVSVYEFGTLPTQPKPQTYMVMEYLPGETLEQRMKRERLSVPEIVSTIEALGQALDYAHNHNVIHRDLKPTNIIFSETGEPVIVDFGLAKLIEISTRLTESTNIGESTMSGTPAYMSPEQLMGSPVTAASDQYSLALIAYHLLTGHFPHDVSSTPILMVDRLGKPPKLASDYVGALSPSVDEVFTRAFSNDPLNRYSSAGEFAHAFGDALLPNRQQARVVTVIDPLQTAMIEATRRMMGGFLRALAAVVLIVMVFCVSLFLRAFQVGVPTFFVWDGILAQENETAPTARTVLGVWPGSPAQQAGVKVGDVINGDIMLDGGKTIGDYKVNGFVRSEMPFEWTRKIGDEIVRPLQRNGQTITVTYKLTASNYFIFQLLVYIIPAIIAFICPVLLLRRWGAEPGLQIFFPLMLATSFYMVTRVMGGHISGAKLIPHLDTFAVHLLLPALIHFMLVFPEPLDFVKKHSRWIWLLYAPMIVALIQLMTGQSIPPNSDWELTMFNFIFWAACVLLLLIFKWARRDVKHYRGMWWYIAAYAVVPIVTLSDTYLGNMDVRDFVKVFGDMSWFYVISPMHISIAIVLAVILSCIGYHRVQSMMGQTLSIAQIGSTSTSPMISNSSLFISQQISEQTPIDKTIMITK